MVTPFCYGYALSHLEPSVLIPLLSYIFFSYGLYDRLERLWLYIYRDVNGVGMVRVIAPPYLTRWINICSILVLRSVQVSAMWVPAFFLISTGTR